MGITEKQWEQRIEQYGFDEEDLKKNYRIKGYCVKGIDDLIEILSQIPINRNGRFVDKDKMVRYAEMDLNDENQRAVVKDELMMPLFFGDINVDMAEYRPLLDNMAKRMCLEVHAAENLTISNESPLIINSEKVITDYKKVTVEQGGYIEISTECIFNCDSMEGETCKFIVKGADGEKGSNGAHGSDGNDGIEGDAAQCDCCGTIPRNDGGKGGKGTNGTDGADGMNGKDGGNGPKVHINITNLNVNLVVVNRGGNGGDGGDGGNGGKGGDGGKGGTDKMCGSLKTNGGNGGDGGNGGNGGKAGSGGNGGNGGMVMLTYTSKVEGCTILPSCIGGKGGNPGIPGSGGAAGAAGKCGGRNSSPGTPGTPGNNNKEQSSSGLDSDNPGEFKEEKNE